MNTEATLHQRIAQLERLLAEKDARLLFLEEQFRLAQQKQFGKSAEGFAGQGELFNEAEEIATLVETEQQDISYRRNKPKRQPLPKDLPREVIVHDISDAEKVCACCHGQLHKIGEDTSEKLDFIPAQVKVIEHVRPKYACRECEKTGTSNPIKQALMPVSPIPKAFYSHHLKRSTFNKMGKLTMPRS